MSNFTPGPWEYKKVWQSPSYEVFREMCHIANVYGAGKKDKANARLIAAAPEMVDKFREALRIITTQTPQHKINEFLKGAAELLRRIDGEESAE